LELLLEAGSGWANRNSKRERQDTCNLLAIDALARSELELVRRTGKLKKLKHTYSMLTKVNFTFFEINRILFFYFK
jgi:hypothetical protein